MISILLTSIFNTRHMKRLALYCTVVNIQQVRTTHTDYTKTHTVVPVLARTGN